MSWQEVVRDELKSGIKTDKRLDAEPPYLGVAWIAWDSGFRGSGLRVGDRIVAIDGERFVPPAIQVEMQAVMHAWVGQYAEHQGYAARGRREGDLLKLTVRRRVSPGDGWIELEVAGVLKRERTWTAERMRTGMSSTGPDRMLKDDFNEVWSVWYEKKIFDWERILDGGWQGSLQTRAVLKTHFEDKPRIEYLLQKYPGEFAQRVLDDWEAVRVCLDGDRVEITSADLKYRTLVEENVKRISEAASRGWKELQARYAAESLPRIPQIDPFRGDRAAVVGKVLVLPAIGPREWLVDMGRGFYAWADGQFWAFSPLNAEPVGRAYAAVQRYKRRVSPTVRDEVAMIGRVLPNPRLLAGSRYGTVAGMEVEPLAMLLGNVVCVDLADSAGAFAGEETLSNEALGPPPDQAGPRDVLNAMIAALKRNDQETWNALFADWHAVPDQRRPIYYPTYKWASRDQDWIRARRLLLDKIFDVRVRWIGDPRVIIRGDEAPGLPRIEEVSAELDHFGLFEGEYRSFNVVDVRRMWSLQRRDGGPWRIASRQSL